MINEVYLSLFFPSTFKVLLSYEGGSDTPVPILMDLGSACENNVQVSNHKAAVLVQVRGETGHNRGRID